MQRSEISTGGLPFEIWLKILSNLDPKHISNMAEINSFFRELLNDNVLWKEKFVLHFPHLFNELKIKTDINWREQFIKAYHSEYFSLKLAIKKLFSLTKEGDVEQLKLSRIELNVIYKFKDAKGVAIVEWALTNKHQTLLNYFFEIAINYYSENGILQPTKVDAGGRTILHWSILCNQPQQISEELLTKGCDINAICIDHKNVFHISCLEGLLDTVVRLKEKKPEFLNSTDNKGNTPVILASARRHHQVVSYLAGVGANLNLYNLKKNSAINFVIDNLETLKVLIKHNADINIKAISTACEEGQLDAVKLLLQANPQLLNQVCNNKTPLMYAASSKQHLIVHYLLGLGVDVTFRNSLNETVLNYSDLETIKLVIKYKNEMAQEALHFACRQGIFDIVEFIILNEYPILFNQPVSLGTPLHVAIRFGHIEIVKLLLDTRVNIHEVNQSGNTALHLALIYGQLHIARELIKRKANINAINHEGKKPLDLALEGKKLQIELLFYSHSLKQHPDYSTTKPFMLFQKGLLPAAKALKKVIFDGADVATLEDNGYKQILEISKFHSLLTKNLKC